MKRFFVVLLCFNLLTCAVQRKKKGLPKRATFLTVQQTNSLARIFDELMPRLSHYVVTSSMKQAYNKVREDKTLSAAEALRALGDLFTLITRSKKAEEMALVLQRISHLKDELTRSSTTKPQAQKNRQAQKNNQNAGSFSRVMRGTLKGFKILSGSAQFRQTEQTKWVAFETPFTTVPTVVFSLRYKDVTYATPVIAGTNTKGFSVRGLSLPPPASNVGFIEYIAVGT
jgi:hypothetical protein